VVAVPTAPDYRQTMISMCRPATICCQPLPVVTPGDQFHRVAVSRLSDLARTFSRGWYTGFRPRVHRRTVAYPVDLSSAGSTRRTACLVRRIMLTHEPCRRHARESSRRGTPHRVCVQCRWLTRRRLRRSTGRRLPAAVADNADDHQGNRHHRQPGRPPPSPVASRGPGPGSRTETVDLPTRARRRSAPPPTAGIRPTAGSAPNREYRPGNPAQRQHRRPRHSRATGVTLSPPASAAPKPSGAPAAAVPTHTAIPRTRQQQPGHGRHDFRVAGNRGTTARRERS